MSWKDFGFLWMVFWVVKSQNYTLYVDTNEYIDIPSPYFGFTFDFWKPDGPFGNKWDNAGILYVNLSNANLIALTAAVSPAILRIGGSPQDSIIYNISGSCLDVNSSLPGYGCSQTSNNFGCLNETRWKQINAFAKETNTSLYFGLNACYGRPTNDTSMNFSNIEQLFNYTVNELSKDEWTNLIGFEFGNEEQNQINADIVAKDSYTLRQILTKYFGFDGIHLVAPDDIGQNSHVYEQYFVDYLGNLSQIATVNETVQAITYHHYAKCGFPNGNISVFSIDCLFDVQSRARYYASLVDQYNTIAWMGEGSEMSGGGTPNVSNTFADSF